MYAFIVVGWNESHERGGGECDKDFDLLLHDDINELLTSEIFFKQQLIKILFLKKCPDDESYF
jgi:hypothetical protein